MHSEYILYILYSRGHNVFLGEAVRCYQCSSHQDAKGEDNCGAYEKFQKDRQIAVECNSDESVAPGSFCMKITQQGPRGFICMYLPFYISS